MAIDLHGTDLVFWQDKKTKKRVTYTPGRPREWFNTVDRFFDIDRLEELLQQHSDIVVAGTAGGNQIECFSLFDKVILLQCDSQTLIHRMKTRTNKSGFGKTKEEQDEVIEWQKEFEPIVLSHGAIPINTEGDIGEVADGIMELSGLAHQQPQ